MAASGLFDNLSGVLSQQFNLGSNSVKSINTVQDGHTVPYGLLGDFANQFDQSEERKYSEEGFFKTDQFNPRVKAVEILMQEPDVTVLVKKRAFSSLADNFKKNILDDEDAKFVRATKFLFQNKCKQISAYERLTKIDSIAKELGSVDYHLLPIIFSSIDALSSVAGVFGSSFGSGLKQVADRVKTIFNLSNDSFDTTWVTNNLDSIHDGTGQGTGVIEFTTAINITTTTRVTPFGGGNFSITFVDPYELMRVTNNDIEQAIADATNFTLGSSFFQFAGNALNQTIDDDKKLLNQVRKARGANPINFIIDPDTFIGKRIRAIVDNSGIEIPFTGGGTVEAAVSLVKSTASFIAGDSASISSTDGFSIDAGYLYPPGEIADIDGLTKDELSIFQRIIQSSYNQMQINANSKTVQAANNVANNQLRKKMRLHYGAKLIIQPMDVVNIFVTSKTQTDPKVMGGLTNSFTSLGVLQTANKALLNLTDFFNGGTSNSLEKSIFVGKDFPNWLWLLLRNNFIVDKSGTQIFSGIVDSATSSYSEGNFTVSIQGSDNAAYFDMGVVNFAPSNEVFNGSLYDPLTPFDIKFDSTTGIPTSGNPPLLKQNQELFQSSFVKYKNGIYAGRKPNEDNFVQNIERIQNTKMRHVFYDPDGMVYKWKQGIGSLVMFGNNYQDSPTTNTGVPPLTGGSDGPFAGQDIMNVLSLLITGEPYNFSTYYKAARQFDNFGRDPATGADPSASFFRNLQTDLKYRNLLYGNFVPFKSFTMGQSAYKDTLNFQNNAQQFDSELSDLIKQRAELHDRATFLAGSNSSADAAKYVALADNELNPKIDAKKLQLQGELSKINQPLSIVGNDISLDYNSLTDISDKNALSQTPGMMRDLKRKTHFLTRKFSWKVRNNEDVNFFIVDDSYDKDYDLQAFEKNFVDAATFKSNYVTVKDKIQSVARLLDLEVFADSQGNIQIRAPKYNLMPSSVFYRMIRMKSQSGIQLYPQFLEDLFINQVDQALEQIETIEDEIRMYGLALSCDTDTQVADLLSSNLATVGSNNGTPFQFLSNETSGKISRLVLKDATLKVVYAENPQYSYAEGLQAFDSLKTQAKINNIFSLVTREQLLDQLTQNKSLIFNNLSDPQVLQRKDIINARLLTSTGQTFDLNQLFTNGKDQVGAVSISETDLFRIMDQIAQRIADRQRTLKVAASALKNAQEGLKIMSNQNGISTQLTTPGLLGNSEVPQAYDALIEDEAYDDYGPNSGSRYVIKNHHIKSFEISEKAPPFNMVEIDGKFGDNFAVDLPQDLNAFQGGGNALSTAVAVDYDMWRMYGLRQSQAIPAPYLTDPESQCAPFAVAMLNKARKQIMSGSINIVGNEYMQPGEVVYLENQDMLFYVESVQHQLSYGRSFQTSLTVGFGHMPGEYIPTYLDTVGKVLYRNKDITNFVHVRQNNINNETHLGCIVADSSVSDPADSIMSGLFTQTNADALKKIIEGAQTAFDGGPDANYTPVLELRIYYASKSSDFTEASSYASVVADTVREYLIGANNIWESTTGDKPPTTFLKAHADNVTPWPVDTDSSTQFRSPSSTAYSMARHAQYLSSNASSQQPNQDTRLIDSEIYDYIVDCWIYFKPNK